MVFTANLPQTTTISKSTYSIITNPISDKKTADVIAKRRDREYPVGSHKVIKAPMGGYWGVYQKMGA